MSTANINIRTDSEIKARAAQIFESLGMDMTTAINIFLRQAVIYNNFPLAIGIQPAVVTKLDNSVRPPFNFGVWENKVWTSEDFDEPLDDFKEYM
jgi:DNA-damage-inducible protein J